MALGNTVTDFSTSLTELNIILPSSENCDDASNTEFGVAIMDFALIMMSPPVPVTADVLIVLLLNKAKSLQMLISPPLPVPKSVLVDNSLLLKIAFL